MRTLALAISLAALFAPNAEAGGRHGHGGWAPVYLWPVDPVPGIREVRPDQTDAAARAAREAHWLAYCQPVAVPDALGVPRYTYRDKRCEEGYAGE